MTVAALAIATPVLAQSGPAGLFGATRPTPDARDLLTLQMAISEALDSKVAPEFRTRLPDGQLPLGRHSNVLTAGVNYSHDRRRLRLSAATDGLFRYSYAVEQVKPGPANAQVGIDVRMARAGTLSLSQGLAYSPSYLYQLLPGEVQIDPDVEAPPRADAEYRIDTRESLSHRTRLGLQTGTGLGWRMTTSAQYSQADFRRDAALGDRQTWQGGVRMSYLPTRRGGITFGYDYRAGRFGAGSRTSEGHELPLGFEFTPALTPTRRLVFRVQVTPSMLDTFTVADVVGREDEDGEAEIGAGDEPGESVVTERRRRYPVQGNVSVTYPFHLRWLFSTGYRRSVELITLLSEPVVTDGAQLSLAGVMGRRVDVSVQGRYAVGSSAAGVGGRHLTTAHGEARVRFALTRSLALSGEYFYYYYDFGGQRRLAPDLPSIHEQHSVRVGISMFTNLLGR